MDQILKLHVDDRGQGAFEYIMLVAGVLLVVVLAIVVLRTNVLPGAGAQLGASVNEWRKLVSLNCTSNNSCLTS